MLSACRIDVDALSYAHQTLCSDRDFVLAAVSEDSRALKYASAGFLGDREFILAAVDMIAEHGWKLLPQYAFDPVSGQVDFKKLAARVNKLKNA